MPWKTRGNGAVALKLLVPESAIPDIFDFATAFVADYSGRTGASNSAVVLHVGSPPDAIRELSKRALSSLVSVDEALRLAQEGVMMRWYRGTGRGLVGALAALGNELIDGDHTYELLAYRREENWGAPRRIDPGSVAAMDREFAHSTFNNLDPETGRILITPHGPDPVLFGIRGESPEVVVEAARRIKVLEDVECCMLFVTNQGTDQHLVPKTIAELEPYDQVCIVGSVSCKPSYITGGHTFFKVCDGTGEVLCAAYEPSGSLSKLVKLLRPGDKVIVCGGVKPKDGKVLNLQKVVIKELSPYIAEAAPRCVGCLRPMKSLGFRKGYFCPRCRFHLPMSIKCRLATRRILPKIILPPPRSQRHLTKPLVRYGREKEARVLGSLLGPLFDGKSMWERREISSSTS